MAGRYYAEMLDHRRGCRKYTAVWVVHVQTPLSQKKNRKSVGVSVAEATHISNTLNVYHRYTTRALRANTNI